MGILDWFKNRAAQFDPDRTSDEMTLAAIDKTVALVNPRLKLVADYRQRLAPAVEASRSYLRDLIAGLPPPLDVAAGRWGRDGQLRAFFAAPGDIPAVLGRSRDLRTLFDKYPALDEGYFILAMSLTEQKTVGLSLRGDVVARDRAQTTLSFSQHRVRICGADENEVRRLLGEQGYEYLVAQALAVIADERSERRGLEDRRAILRARLRLLQQQGPGLGSLFDNAPAPSEEARQLEADLLANERAIEAQNGVGSTLENELDLLRSVLAEPQRYLGVEHRRVDLDAMNVVVDASADVSVAVAFSLATLSGVPPSRTSFVLARLARAELPAARIDFAEAARAL